MTSIDHQIADLETQLATLNATLYSAHATLNTAREAYRKAYSESDTVWHRIQVLRYKAECQRQLTLATAPPSPAAACPSPGTTPQPADSTLPAVHGTVPGADFSPVTINQSDPLNT